MGEYETSIFKYINISNSSINGILNFKIKRCHANHFDIKVELDTDFEGFETTDICVLLSNLLDNAIEASLKVQSPHISISIKEKMNYLCILVRNRIETSILSVNLNLKTTKKENGNHGLGLYSIAQIVGKYEGFNKNYEENDFFVSDIWLKKHKVDFIKHIEMEANYHTRQK